jgi:hypothetical protein
MRTFKERLIAGLQTKGWKQVETASSKYTCFRNPNNLAGPLLYVGFAGALRAGPCASQSHSVGDPQRPTAFYKGLLAAGDAALPARAYRASGITQEALEGLI